jgi:hypothetical protein
MPPTAARATAAPLHLGLLAPPESTRAATAATGISLKDASATVAGLSSPGKMPCWSYGLPAAECKVGSKLRASSTEEKPTVCGGCYALKGSYTMYPEVIPAQYRRFATVKRALADDGFRAEWLHAMVTLIAAKSRESRVFRWHDSGDLIDVDHLRLLVDVADALPWVRFWIPTREAATVARYIREDGPLPANFAVRQSAALVDHFPNPERATGGRTFSAVAKNADIPDDAHACPAYRQNGECGSCRACWDPSVPVVVYPLH